MFNPVSREGEEEVPRRDDKLVDVQITPFSFSFYDIFIHFLLFLMRYFGRFFVTTFFPSSYSLSMLFVVDFSLTQLRAVHI